MSDFSNARSLAYRRSEIAVLGVILAMAAAVRLLLLVKADWMADYDESLVGLMAIDITRGERPVFLYGVPYMGALESYLAAMLFTLFDVSRQALKVVPLLMSLGWVLTAYLLAHRLWGYRAASIAAALASLPTLYVLSNTLKAWGTTVETMALGNLILLSVVSIAAEAKGRRRAWWWAGLGFLVGLGFWLYWLVAYYVAAAVAYLLVRRPAFLWRLDLWPALPAFALGSLPLWLYNLRHDWATFRYLLGEGKPGGTGVGQPAIAWDMVGRLIPRVFGAESPVWSWLAWVGVVAVATALAILMGHCLRARWERVPSAAEIVALFVIFVPPLYLISGFGAAAVNSYGIDAAGRYVVPLFGAAPLALAFLYHSVSRRLAVAAVIFLCVVNLAGVWNADGKQVFQSPYYNRAPASFAATISALQEEGIRHVWTDVGLGQPLMFQSKQEILAADYLDRQAGGILRFPAAYAAVERADRTAYLVATLPGQVGPLERQLERLGVPNTRREIGSLTLLVPARRVEPAEVVAGLGYQY